MNLPALADLLASRGLRLLPGSYAVPVELLVQLPDATIAHFTARGTTLRLRTYAPDALTTITIPAECGCGDHHPQTGPTRVVLSRYATPLEKRTIHGGHTYNWHHHEAGLLPLPTATHHFLALLSTLPTPTSGTLSTPAHSLVPA
ncbi:hypothetical protein PWY87_26505 [Kribbella solani]|uniref:hypothetical protein n=1 Tax=Kribbella solani TaxID=236067 RepID=UPI0029A655F1|nr:hypothetical protein [Kribbella solani]MDX2974393.1 hypothetical protein [Kribbella solani]MDX3005256.1 hypothetical protein [Kribbella solani]